MFQQKHFQVMAAFIVGLVFSLGLGISGMTQPQKVIGFLQLGKGWDPSLMFVMIGAISVHAVVYSLVRRKSSPLFDTKWHVPTSREVTKPLMVGSALFGFGWALGGFCPGPALTSAGAGTQSALIFIVFMFAGMMLHRVYQRFLKN